MMERIFKIFRFDPQQDDAPRFQEYRVAVEQTDKILDCLNRIRWEQDPLAFPAHVMRPRHLRIGRHAH